jgi:hypothetical protein
MRTVKELSISLSNKPGRMATILSGLSKEKVNLIALAVMDVGGRSMMRLVTDDLDHTRELLDAMNIRYAMHDVLLVEVLNQPGSFSNVCSRLASEHLSLDYAYCSSSTSKNCHAVIRVNNLAKAQHVLDSTNGTSARVKRPGRRPVHAR